MKLKSAFESLANCDEKFPIELQDYCDWIGNDRQRNVARSLIKNFEAGVDYRIETCRSTVAGLIQHGGSNKKNYHLTKSCFKHLALRANTKRAKEVRDYFIEVELVAQEFVRQVKAGEIRVSTRADCLEKTKLQSKALKDAGFSTPESQAKINGAINLAVSGFTKSALRKKLGIIGSFTQRDYFNQEQLELLQHAIYSITIYLKHIKCPEELTTKIADELLRIEATRKMGGLGGQYRIPEIKTKCSKKKKNLITAYFK